MKTKKKITCRKCKKLISNNKYLKHLDGPCGEFLSVKEASEIYTLSRSTIQRLNRAGHLTTKKVGRETLILRYGLLVVQGLIEKRKPLIPMIRLFIQVNSEEFFSKEFRKEAITKQEKWLKKIKERGIKSGLKLKYWSCFFSRH